MINLQTDASFDDVCVTFLLNKCSISSYALHLTEQARASSYSKCILQLLAFYRICNLCPQFLLICRSQSKGKHWNADQGQLPLWDSESGHTQRNKKRRYQLTTMGV